MTAGIASRAELTLWRFDKLVCAMLCNDPATFSFVISTKNRPAFVRRSLDFLGQQGFSGSILIVDASDEAGFAETGEFLAAMPPRIQVNHFRPTPFGNNWQETAEGCRALTSKYVMWHHDDDFYFLDAVNIALEALERDSDAVSAQGREVFMTARLTDGQVSVRLWPSPRFAYHGASPLDRLKEAFGTYCHLFFAVMRRSVFVEACELTSRYLKQGWFDQYAWSLISAMRGRSLLTDRFYGVRQNHKTNHSGQILKRHSYDHWPLIVANRDFSRIYSDFKDCLIDAMGTAANGSMTDLSSVLDHGLVSLIDRQYRAGHEPDAIDAVLFKSCFDQSSEASRRLSAIVKCIAAHPETV